MNPTDFEAIISGQRKGRMPSLARHVLAGLQPVYWAGLKIHQLPHHWGVKKRYTLEVPVISVGNVTTGGTGKTPFTAYLVQLLQELGCRPGIASRGYQALSENEGQKPVENDEARVLAELCPGIPHRQNRNRVQAGEELQQRDRCDVILLDDGFQHWRLNRTLDLVLIDALNPFGYDHLLPRGLLRESLSALQRADAVIITRVDLVTVERLMEIKTQISRFTQAPIADVAFVPTHWQAISGDHLPLDHPFENPAAFCGIGNPHGFRQLLLGTGIELTEESWHIFPDHHHYTQKEMQKLSEQTVSQHWLTTLKDLVKLEGLLPHNVECYALGIGAQLRDGEAMLQKLIKTAVGK